MLSGCPALSGSPLSCPVLLKPGDAALLRTHACVPLPLLTFVDALVRLGPFVSTPELAWRNLRTSPFDGKILKNGDAIVQHASLPILWDGTPIGYNFSLSL